MFLLLVLVLVPFITAFLVRQRFTGKVAFVGIVVVSSLMMSSLVIVQWWAYNAHLERQIAPLDRDGDGFWSTAEQETWTEQDRQNMAAYIGDGGRNVWAIGVAPVLSVAYSTGVAAVSGWLRW
ncbi:MAG: hypothetical protein ACFBSG_20940 [Leptolyngbyaceae cyanobacterium]